MTAPRRLQHPQLGGSRARQHGKGPRPFVQPGEQCVLPNLAVLLMTNCSGLRPHLLPALAATDCSGIKTCTSRALHAPEDALPTQQPAGRLGLPFREIPPQTGSMLQTAHPVPQGAVPSHARCAEHRARNRVCVPHRLTRRSTRSLHQSGWAANPRRAAVPPCGRAAVRSRAT